MIDPAWCRTMARYNLWQNRAIAAAADPLGEVLLFGKRGASDASIAGILSHLLWSDQVWMARFDGGAPPDAPPGGNGASGRNWEIYRDERAQTDTRILDWASSLDVLALDGEVFWMSKSAARIMSRPMAICVSHFFLQQAHYRGSVHAILAQLGVAIEDSALFLLPDLLE